MFIVEHLKFGCVSMDRTMFSDVPGQERNRVGQRVYQETSWDHIPYVGLLPL